MSTPQQLQANGMIVPPPLAAPRKMGGTATPYMGMDQSTYRPGYHLTPVRLWAIYRMAEGGTLAPQADLFEDLLENDGHMRGQYVSRMSLALRPWVLMPGDDREVSIKAAAALWLALRRCNMTAALRHLMEALGYGYAGVNIAWRFNQKAGTVEPQRFLLTPQRRFIVDSQDGCLKFITPDMPSGEELRAGEWLITQQPHRIIARAGIFRTTGWWCLFKRMQITDWMVFAEKFGIPFVLGMYEERASPESRVALLQAITDIGTDGQAMLAETTKIVVGNEAIRNGDVAQLHPAIVARCDAEISKVITGATLNVETGGPGSFALGKVHEGRATSLSFADALWLQESINDGVCVPFCEYNPQFADAAPPRISIRVQPEMPPETRVKVYQVLQAMGLELDEEQLYEEFGLRRPTGSGDLKPLYAVSPPTPPVPEKP